MKKYPNSVWQRDGFCMCGLDKKCKIIDRIMYFKRCIKWSWQRIVRGYSDYDKWGMYGYLQKLIPDMLQDLRNSRMGSPGYLGENYTNEKGILVNDKCHAEWDEILDRMIFLWREIDEDTCSKKNPYDKEYSDAMREFTDQYGMLGEKLQTEKELENNKMSGNHTIHFMNELPQYKEISDKYQEEERKLEKYREECKDEAFDLLKRHFFDLWD